MRQPGATRGVEAAPAPAAVATDWSERRVLPPMISYAQNFEDVLLRRALPDITRGFYIDIGAFHPVVDNVTQWFYSQGWTGINVEPNPAFQDLLRAQRPHDLNLAVAVSGQTGPLHLHLLDGLSTTIKDVAHQHATGGRVARAVIAIDALSLTDLFERHLDERTVDFLKIDVEGAEASILMAYPFVRVRPRILVIEATEPDSIASASLDWEPDLLAKGYRFCCFDGLNRYYVRDEDAWRTSLFAVPPNVFDNFLLPYTDRRIDYVGAARYVLDQAPEGGIHPLLNERDSLRRERDILTAQVAALSSDRDAWAKQSAQLLSEREAFAVQMADFAQAQAAERDAFAVQVADLAQAQTAEREAFAVRVADIARAQAAEGEAFAVQVADIAQAQAVEREAFAVQVADIAQAQAVER
ncbi:FkbM family methyltransferase, partial [uncultured Methylobacterium sp.]|uniref:FkbM family methyltransferase n=1 Tax=uncultured Methylobacterium sp. TaxID=157278 RepID=UPI0035C9CD05